MQLISLGQQSVAIDNHRFHFDDGEAIVTEYSYKYTIESFQELAAEAGFVLDRHWLDHHELFSVHFLRCQPDA